VAAAAGWQMQSRVTDAGGWSRGDKPALVRRRDFRNGRKREVQIRRVSKNSS